MAPRLRLRLDPTRAGEDVRAVLLIDSDTPVDARQVDFELYVLIHVNQKKYRVPLERQSQALAGILGLGRSQIAVSFALPAGLTPSLHAQHLSVRYFVDARIDLPWSLDPQVSEELIVRPGAPIAMPPVRLELPDRGLVVTTREHEDGLTVVVDSGQVVDRHDLTVRLVASIHLEDELPVDLFALDARPSFAGPDTRHEFVFATTEWLPGSFSAPLASLRWSVRVRLSLVLFGASRWELPLELAMRLPSEGALLRAPLDPRRAFVPALSAEDHEVLLDHHFDHEDDVARGVIAGTSVVLRREPVGYEVILAVELRFPSLALDLRARQTTGRETAALTGFAWPLVVEHIRDDRRIGELATLLAGLGAFSCLRLDDERAVLERADGPLSMPLAELSRLCLLLARVRSEIGPPTSVLQHLYGWRELAAELGGTLRATDLSLVGTLLGLQVSAQVVWQGNLPEHTRLSVAHGRPIPGSYRASADQVVDEHGAPAGEAYRIPLLALLGGADSAELTGEALSVHLRGGADAEQVRRTLTRMVEIARVLHAGPAYR